MAKNRRCIKSVRSPKYSSDLNPAEVSFNRGKDDILGSMVPDSFKKLGREASEYYRTKSFKLNIVNYICP